MRKLLKRRAIEACAVRSYMYKDITILFAFTIHKIGRDGYITISLKFVSYFAKNDSCIYFVAEFHLSFRN
jgi:hypothetical protein